MIYLQNNKYYNKTIIVDGVVFQSKREARRWLELKLLERSGEITDLRRQVKFELIPAQREPDTYGPRGGVIKGKVLEKEVAYWADFTYVQNGELIVEDCKGYKGGGAYAVFTIKRKLMFYLHGIRIKEI